MKRVLHLILVPFTLTGVALRAFQLAQYSWDQVAEYKSPFAGPPPCCEEGQPPVERVVMVLIDGLRLDASHRWLS